MSDDRVLAEALRLFDRYSEMTAARREKALAGIKRNDAPLYAELKALLEADAVERDLVAPVRLIASLGRDAAAPEAGSSADPRIGSRLGAWRIDSVLGTGGMGTIYSAHRADGQYEQAIALKTIRAGLCSPALSRAFRNERSLLARLEHPAIVPLLDAGVDDDGQPWLAMQRVDGQPIDQWCDERQACLRTRARLLIAACEALHHAHARGVLHQDIKPSNLLVTMDGRVKLLDFGLSAMLTATADHEVARIGISSGYAAPEAVRGAAPSVAIDIYALGVVLYQLLCAEFPYKPGPAPQSLPFAEAPVRRPSALALRQANAVGLHRGLRDATTLARRLRGDPDAIALRCVAHAPERRYADMDALRRDLQAWLEHRPVTARAGGWRYRTLRFARRHVAVLATGALLAVSVAVGTSAFVLQWRQARQASASTAILNELFEQSLGAATLSSLGEASLGSRELLARTERRLRSGAGGGNPQLLSRGLAVLARNHLVSGNYAYATRLVQEARTLGDGDALQAARTHATLAQLLNTQARPAEAERAVREGLALVPSRLGDDDELTALDLRMQLARARWGKGDPEGAIATLDDALRAAERLGDAGIPARAELLAQRGYDYTQLYRLKPAEADLREAIAILGERSPIVANTARRQLAMLLILTERHREAVDIATATLDTATRTFGSGHPETGRAWVVVGKAQYYLGENAQAAEALAKADAILRGQLGPWHPEVAELSHLQQALAFDKGRLKAVVDVSRRVVAVMERAYGLRHETTLKHTTNLASILLLYAQSLDVRQGRPYAQEAEALLARTVRLGERQHLPIAYARAEYARALLGAGRLQEAHRQTMRAIGEMTSLFGRDSRHLIPARISLARVLIAQGRHDEAATLGTALLAAAAPEDESPYEHYLYLELLLDNEIARGDAAGVRRSYDRIARVAERHDFMEALNAKAVPGIGR